MINAVDTNILLDILIPNTAFVQSALQCLSSIDSNDELIISEVVFAELGAQFLSFTHLGRFLGDTGIRLVPSNEDSLFEASRAWKQYHERKQRTIVCASCGNEQIPNCSSCNQVISLRQHILADFLIGAHAKIHADRFVTRDRGFYLTYFKDLNVITP